MKCIRVRLSEAHPGLSAVEDTRQNLPFKMLHLLQNINDLGSVRLNLKLFS